MKKSLFIAAMLVISAASASAIEYTAKAFITLGTNTLKLREAADFSTTAFDNGADMSSFNTTGVVAYATLTGNTSSVRWSQFAGDDLEGVVVAFKVAAAGEQTLTFSDVTGTPLYLVDAVTGARTAIVNDGTYVFTAEAADVSAWNTTRFTISKVLPAKPYTFINNVLVINEATEGAEITITPFTYGVDGKDLGDPIITHAPMDEDLTGMGYLLITYTNAEGVAREFIINTNPDVQPAND